MSGEHGKAYWCTCGGMSVQGVKCSCSSQIQKVRAGSCCAVPASTSWKDQTALREESKTIMLIPRNNEVATTATSEAGASEASKDASSWKTLAASWAFPKWLEAMSPAFCFPWARTVCLSCSGDHCSAMPRDEDAVVIEFHQHRLR
eukprot:5732410-Amphidinium_carterae.1